MKQVSQVEFEKLIQDLIEGKTTREKLAKILETDIRTINYKIRQLSEQNPSLYEEYVKKFPYRPKTRDDIDYEALVIKIMKDSENLDKMEVKYGISKRTISRRIKDLEKTNPELIKLYREYAECVRRCERLPNDLQMKINQLPEKTVILSEVTEKKEVELRATLQKFEELVKSGMSKAEAARTLGYDGYPTIWKKQQEFARIEAEKKAKESSASKDFRQSMKLKVSQLDIKKTDTIETNTESKEVEGR